MYVCMCLSPFHVAVCGNVHFQVVEVEMGLAVIGDGRSLVRKNHHRGRAILVNEDSILHLNFP